MQATEKTFAFATTNDTMSPLRHIVEPDALLLTWQPSDEQSANRTRRVVARIERLPDGNASFRYLVDTDDYTAAVAAGFQGHPAFQLGEKEVTSGVMDALLRRLPPRKRDDFREFLALHRLPNPFNFSDFALLAYTNARLPSDGFAIVPDMSPDLCPCDYILEVAGFRHEPSASIERLSIGDSIDFVVEESNPYDTKAIAIYHETKKIGYVNRALKELVRSWIQNQIVAARIERINGKPERPLVYIRVEVR